MVGAVSGPGLLVVSFVPWYSARGEELNAWEAFGVLDVVLAVAAVMALSVALVALTRLSVSYPVAGSSVTAGIGIIAFFWVLYRVINPPGSGDLDREAGAWLGLLATAGIAWGGYLGMQEPGLAAARPPHSERGA